MELVGHSSQLQISEDSVFVLVLCEDIETCLQYFLLDFTVIPSHGTLVICPASLIHHWKKEIERRVVFGKLRVCLYHGANRDKHAEV